MIDKALVESLPGCLKEAALTACCFVECWTHSLLIDGEGKLGVKYLLAVWASRANTADKHSLAERWKERAAAGPLTRDRAAFQLQV